MKNLLTAIAVMLALATPAWASFNGVQFVQGDAWQVGYIWGTLEAWRLTDDSTSSGATVRKVSKCIDTFLNGAIPNYMELRPTPDGVGPRFMQLHNFVNAWMNRHSERLYEPAQQLLLEAMASKCLIDVKRP